MSRKPSLLAAVLKNPEPAVPAPEPADQTMAAIVPAKAPKVERPAAPYVPPSRANKVGRTHHLLPAYWETLEEISFRTRDEKGKRVPQERLVAEALNLLFAKYNYPVVRE